LNVVKATLMALEGMKERKAKKEKVKKGETNAS